MAVNCDISTSFVVFRIKYLCQHYSTVLQKNLGPIPEVDSNPSFLAHSILGKFLELARLRLSVNGTF